MVTKFIWGLGFCAALSAPLAACAGAPRETRASPRVEAPAPAPSASAPPDLTLPYSTGEFPVDRALSDRLVPGPSRASVSSLAELDGVLFAGIWQSTSTGSGGVFRSFDKGVHFERASRGLPRGSAWRKPTALDPYAEIISLGVDHGVLLAGTLDGRIFRSVDHGEHWVAARFEPPVKPSSFLGTWRFVTLGDKTFARVGYGVHVSSDRGATWLPQAFPSEDGFGYEIRSIAGADGVLYAASPLGILVSSDEGAHAKLEKSPLEPFELWARAGALYVAGTGMEEAYVSRDRARSFQPLTSLFGGMHGPLHVYGFDWAKVPPVLWEARAVLEVAGTRYIAESNGVVWSSDGGEHLNRSSAGLTSLPLTRVAVTPERVLVADPDGLWSAPLDFSKFERVRTLGGQIDALSAHGADVFVGDSYGRLFESHDGGLVFNEVDLPKTGRRGAVQALAATGSHRLLVRGGILVSHDAGRHFRDVHQAVPLEATQGYPGEFRYELEHAVVTDKALLLGGSRGLFRSDDDGAHFKAVELPGPLQWLTALLYERGVVYAATSGEIFVSHDDGKSFQSLLRLPATPYAITSVAVTGDDIALTLRNEKATTPETLNRILVSRDAGKTFRAATPPLDASPVSAPARGADAWYIGLESDGLWRVPVHN